MNPLICMGLNGGGYLYKCLFVPYCTCVKQGGMKMGAYQATSFEVNVNLEWSSFEVLRQRARLKKEI